MGEQWESPASICFPTIRKRFEIINPMTQKNVRYLMQDIPEHMHNIVVQLMTTDGSEPIPSCTKLSEHLQESIEDDQKYWRSVLQQQLSLICFVEKEDSLSKIAGVYINIKRTQNDPESNMFQGNKLKNVAFLTNHLMQVNKFYEQFYITEVAINVGGIIFPEHDIQQIHATMSECSGLLCKSIGITMMLSLSTSQNIEKLMASVGFKAHMEMTYEEVENIGLKFNRKWIQKFGQRIQLLYKVL